MEFPSQPGPPPDDVLGALHVDHMTFAVADVAGRAAELVDRYRFQVLATHSADDHLSVVLGQGKIMLVLTEGRAEAHPASVFVQLHGDGVMDVALRAPDARAAFARATGNGARPATEPVEVGDCVTASIAVFGDVTHTFVTVPAGSSHRYVPGVGPVPSPAAGAGRLDRVDHFAVCLPPGELRRVVEFYERVLTLRTIFTDRIAVASQAMNSAVVQSPSGDLTLTLLEPDPTTDAGQIDDFLKDHGGPGMQHVAFATDDIVRTVGDLTARGVEFLDTPGSYYELLAKRITPLRHSFDRLRRYGILLDEDSHGQLFQIFARSTHPRRTFFFEVIERLHARTFGTGNIKALYEAVELERIRAARSD